MGSIGAGGKLRIHRKFRNHRKDLGGRKGNLPGGLGPPPSKDGVRLSSAFPGLAMGAGETQHLVEAMFTGLAL